MPRRPSGSATPIHLRAKRNGVRSTARRLGAASSILFYMGVHDIDAMQWIARSRITPRLCAEARGARHRQRGRALCGGQFRERRHRQHRLQLGLAGRADERLPLVARDRRHADPPPISTAPTRASTSSTTAARAAATRISGPRSTAGSSATWPTRSTTSSRPTLSGTALSAALSRGVRRHSGARCAGAIGANRACRSMWCAERSALLPNG